MIKGKTDGSFTSNIYFLCNNETVGKLIRAAKSVGLPNSEFAQKMDAWCSNKMTVEEKLGVLDEKLLQ